MSSFSSPPIVVIGAGAAGLMAARFAADAGARVVLLERTRQGGKKIVISGGGRCNVLPSEVDPRRFVTASSPHLLRRMLLSWPLNDQRRYFEEVIGLRLVREEATGKLFPASNDAREVRDRLIAAARDAGADLHFNTLVADVRPGDRVPWRVELENDAPLEAAAVILATGGLSVPQTGSDGAGLRLARQLGHTLHPTYPALTPLIANPAPHADLSGISLDVHLTAPLKKGRFETEGGFLFTHRGYSGPAVLDLSHLTTLAREAGQEQPVRVQWTGWSRDDWEHALQENGAGLVATLLRQHLPARLAERIQEEAGVPADRTRAHLRRDERRRLVDLLTAYPLPWTGDEGYKKAEVTGGGVALGEVDPHTMESRLRPGLFLCGELLDAFGPIGGYNFMWAWATGRAAGLGAAARTGR